jgi:hypothetical protein
MLTLNANGFPTAANIPSGCTGPNEDCVDGLNAVFGPPLEAGKAFPNGSAQGVFWGRWQNGTINSDTPPTILGPTANAHFMYGTLTPAETLFAKTGALDLKSTFPGGYGTTPTNNLGETPTGGTMPVITVNFTARTATASASSAVFPSQTWSIPGGSGPITIVPGAGGYFLVQGSGTHGTGGWFCSGTGCNSIVEARAAGIFLGPVGDHAGVALGARSRDSMGNTTANFGAVRLFCASGC